MRLRRALLLATLGVMLGTISCSGFETGPSLPVDVQIQSLRPTTGDAARCCCHVTGTVQNQGSVPVHVTIKFGAFRAAEAESFARILYFIRDMQPNESQAFEASGFVYPCADIDRVEIDDVDVTGIVFPS